MKVIINEIEVEENQNCGINIKIEKKNGKLVASAVTEGDIDYNSAMVMLSVASMATTKLVMPEYEPTARGIKMLMNDIMDCANEGLERALEGE